MDLRDRAVIAHQLHERISRFSNVIAKFRNGDLSIMEAEEHIEINIEYLRDTVLQAKLRVKEVTTDDTAPA